MALQNSEDRLRKNSRGPHGIVSDIEDPLHFANTAEPLLVKGWTPIPVWPNSKKSYIRNRSEYALNPPAPSTIAQWKKAYAYHGTGIVCGPCFAFDIDVNDPVLAQRLEAIILERVGGTPLKLIGQAPKFKLIFRTFSAIGTSHLPGIDFLGVGSYFVAFGIHPGTGLPYRWQGDSPLARPLTELPMVTAEQIDGLRVEFGDLLAPITHFATSPAPVAEGAQRQGLITDNRDTVLMKLVWHVWAAGEDDADVIADRAFAQLALTADLSRPKRGGKVPWTRADALKKAKNLLASGKVRPSTPSGKPGAAQDDQRERFQAAVYRIAAYRHLSLAAVQVSDLMLSLAYGPDGCFATPATIAERLDLGVDAVKRARRRLVELGLWSVQGPGAGRGHRAHYFPEFLTSAAIAEKVTAKSTRSSREERDYLEEESLNPKNNKNYDSVFESLADWMPERGE